MSVWILSGALRLPGSVQTHSRLDCLATLNCQEVRVPHPCRTHLERVQECIVKGFYILQRCNNFLQLDQGLCVYSTRLQEEKKTFQVFFFSNPKIKVLGLPVRATVDSVCPELRTGRCWTQKPECIWTHLLKCRWFSFPLIQA